MSDIKVLSSQGTAEAYRELVPRFEQASGHRVVTVFTGTIDAEKRLAAGESYDLVIISAPSIDDQIKSGRIAAGSRVDIARSGIGAGVKAGAPKPDIGTVEALQAALLAAKSIGYSTGPSGVAFAGVLQKLGLAETLKNKIKQTPTGVLIGSIVASGEAEIGFQQVSEISHFPGVDYVGPLPGPVQHTTIFSAGIMAGARQPDAARALIRFITAPAAAQAFKKHGMEPG
jgi:molybdate transport system substrate-binding protein